LLGAVGQTHNGKYILEQLKKVTIFDALTVNTPQPENITHRTSPGAQKYPVRRFITLVVYPVCGFR